MDNIGSFFKKQMQKTGMQSKFDELMKTVYADEDIQAFFKQHKDELNELVIQRSAGTLYEFVSQKNKIENGEKALVKGHYPHLEIHNHQIEIVYQPTAEYLEKRADHEAQARFQTIYLPESLKRYTFDDIYITKDRAKALKGIHRCLTQLTDKNRDDQLVKGLYLHGTFGSGKTFMLGVLAKELAEKGYEVIMVHYPQFTQEMKNSIRDNTTQDKIEQFKRIPILILDDIGAEKNSSWLRDDVLGVILQHRMHEELTTFFTSNMGMDQLGNDHFAYSDNGQVEEKLKSARLMERIRFLAEEIEVGGENYRQKR